jgi:hypothetical protein
MIHSAVQEQKHDPFSLVSVDVLILASFHLLASLASAAEPAAWPHSAAVPREAYVTLEISKPRSVLDQLFQPRVVQAVTSHPEYQRRRNDPEFLQVVNLVEYLEGRFETDLHGLLNKLMGGGVTLAVGPGPQMLLIVEAEDAVVLNEVHDFFLMIARNEAEQAGPERPGEVRRLPGGNGLEFRSRPSSRDCRQPPARHEQRPDADCGNRPDSGPEPAEFGFAAPLSASSRGFRSAALRLDVCPYGRPEGIAADESGAGPGKQSLATLLLAPLMQALQQSNGWR